MFRFVLVSAFQCLTLALKNSGSELGHSVKRLRSVCGWTWTSHMMGFHSFHNSLNSNLHLHGRVDFDSACCTCLDRRIVAKVGLQMSLRDVPAKGVELLMHQSELYFVCFFAAREAMGRDEKPSRVGVLPDHDGSAPERKAASEQPRRADSQRSCRLNADPCKYQENPKKLQFEDAKDKMTEFLTLLKESPLDSSFLKGCNVRWNQEGTKLACVESTRHPHSNVRYKSQICICPIRLKRSGTAASTFLAMICAGTMPSSQ